ncbi:glycosyltransferase family 2 protein [Aureliella helgolandensis]|nr:glycosyltransferase family 2 protein [Aureliella helgolandensis]
MLRQTVVIIPARNEESSIGLVLADLPPVAIVIVVNNGSTDSTRSIAQQAGAFVVDEDMAGYGRACRRGLYALKTFINRSSRENRGAGEPVDSPRLSEPIRYVVFLDADYSDHPELLPELVKPIHQGRADFVLGSRLLGRREPGAMPVQSVLGNKLACFLIRIVWGGRYTDLGPFRAIALERLNILQMKDTNFGWTVEMQIKAVQHRLRTLEIPVPYRRRIGTSKISGTISGTFRAGYKILYTIGKYALLRSPGRLPS